MSSVGDHTDQKDTEFFRRLNGWIGGAVFLFVGLSFVYLLFDPNESRQPGDAAYLDQERTALMEATASSIAWDHIRQIVRTDAVLSASGRSTVVASDPWKTVETKLQARGWSKCAFRHPSELFKYGKGRYRVSGYYSKRQGSQVDVSFHLRDKENEIDCSAS